MNKDFFGMLVFAHCRCH